MSNVVYDNSDQVNPGDPSWLATIAAANNDTKIACIRIRYSFGTNKEIASTCRSIFGVYGNFYEEFHCWSYGTGEWVSNQESTRIPSFTLARVTNELRSRLVTIAGAT